MMMMMIKKGDVVMRDLVEAVISGDDKDEKSKGSFCFVKFFHCLGIGTQSYNKYTVQ